MFHQFCRLPEVCSRLYRLVLVPVLGCRADQTRQTGRFVSEAYLARRRAERGRSSDSAVHANRPSETEREILLGMLFLSATCVSVAVGFVPPQSLTLMDYLYLRQKVNASHILCASNQVLKQKHIFCIVEKKFL